MLNRTEEVIKTLMDEYESNYIISSKSKSLRSSLLISTSEELGAVTKYKKIAMDTLALNNIFYKDDLVLVLKNCKETLSGSYNYFIILAATIAIMMAFMTILVDTNLISNSGYIMIAVAAIISLFTVAVIRDKKNNQIIKFQKIINILDSIDNEKLMKLKKIKESKKIKK